LAEGCIAVQAGAWASGWRRARVSEKPAYTLGSGIAKPAEAGWGKGMVGAVVHQLKLVADGESAEAD
jgi:hypothetical protein